MCETFCHTRDEPKEPRTAKNVIEIQETENVKKFKGYNTVCYRFIIYFLHLGLR